LKSLLPEKSKHIASCLELAILLESSAHKPGNVSIVTNFEGTHYEHFLASAVAASSSFESAAMWGLNSSENKRSYELGRSIKECVKDIATWQHGGNTLLGTVILLSPMAIAAGITLAEESFEITSFRRSLKVVVESTTPEDAVNLYSAIAIANPGGLGKAPGLDVTDPTSKQRILDQKISLYEVFKIAEKYDTICSEWTSNYQVTFDIAYPFLAQRLKKDTAPSKAVVQSFLEVLARVPDTFIARKAGIEKAREVSLEAKEIVELGGAETPAGRKKLRAFDHGLRRSGNMLNPGTTADLVAAALAVCVLDGYRP
jgi:triphosphoribosyl-dephospho-CoA synthase